MVKEITVTPQVNTTKGSVTTENTESCQKFQKLLDKQAQQDTLTEQDNSFGKENATQVKEEKQEKNNEGKSDEVVSQVVSICFQIEKGILQPQYQVKDENIAQFEQKLEGIDCTEQKNEIAQNLYNKTGEQELDIKEGYQKEMIPVVAKEERGQLQVAESKQQVVHDKEVQPQQAVHDKEVQPQQAVYDKKVQPQQVAQGTVQVLHNEEENLSNRIDGQDKQETASQISDWISSSLLQEKISNGANGQEQVEILTEHTNYIQTDQELKEVVVSSLLKGIKGDKQMLELQLNPQNLGKLSIQIVHENGETSVSILCSNSETAKALSQTAQEIGRIMEQNLKAPTTIVVDTGHIEQDYLQQQGNGHQNQEQQEQQRQQAKQQEEGETKSFLEQLRLGLV